MVRVTTVWHVCADQGYRMSVDRYRCCNDTFADTFSPIDCFPPPAVHNDRHTMFVHEFAPFHNDVSGSTPIFPCLASTSLRPRSRLTLCLAIPEGTPVAAFCCRLFFNSSSCLLLLLGVFNSFFWTTPSRFLHAKMTTMVLFS